MTHIDWAATQDSINKRPAVEINNYALSTMSKFELCYVQPRDTNYNFALSTYVTKKSDLDM
jgi:hypothetical protein